jgi:hypothetical protein
LCIGSTATLSAFGAGTYSWSSGGTGLTETVSPVVETTYTLTGAINGICQQVTTITQSVISCIGLEEHNGSKENMLVFPNPSSGNVNIKLNSLSGNTSVEIITLIGQAVFKENISDTNEILNLNGLAKGIYFIQLKENNKIIKSTQLVIQ